MCLDTVSKTFSGKGTKVFVVYKAFIKRDGVLLFPYCLHNAMPLACEGIWLTANEGSLFGDRDGREYPQGFHSFATKEDAESWARNNIHPDAIEIRCVRGRGIFAVGNHALDRKSLVFRQMFIPKKRTKGEGRT